jgi:LmbE family N-acetylglucosaminyl deacetylase
MASVKELPLLVTTESVLVVAPHGLDEVLGCGGMIARQAGTGALVTTMILFGDGEGHDASRRRAAETTAELLGAGQTVFSGFPENRSDTIPLVEIVAAIEVKVRDLCATTVLLPSPASLNVDHRNSFQAGVTALRPTPSLPVTRILAYEIISSTDWAPQMHWDVFRPNVFVDIAEFVSLKEKALQLYGDDMRAPPHARTIESVAGLAKLRGATVGMFAAEAFELVRETVA